MPKITRKRKQLTVEIYSKRLKYRSSAIKTNIYKWLYKPRALCFSLTYYDAYNKSKEHILNYTTDGYNFFDSKHNKKSSAKKLLKLYPKPTTYKVQGNGFHQVYDQLVKRNLALNLLHETLPTNVVELIGQAYPLDIEHMTVCTSGN